VCPTGIDIREGIQIACINCGLCADACDHVMEMVGRPRGLIAFDSEANVERRAKGEPSKLKIFRPRTFVYMAVITLASGAFLYEFLTIDKVELSVLPERKPAYVLLSDGDIRNTYNIHIVNKYHANKDFRIAVDELGEGSMWQQGGVHGQGPVDVVIGPDQVGHYRFFVSLKPGELDGTSRPLHFTLTDAATGEVIRKETVFIGPAGE
jgi:polyferredoxin